ncbi:MAG: amidohydrolase [Armatimonadetes bacterium]|nr:amidohydrolase [Armatimonadota bacterium]
MIDIHSHWIKYPGHVTDAFVEEASIARGRPVDLNILPEDYLKAMEPVEKCVVFGMKACLSGFYTPNEDIAAFASYAPEKIVPFMSVDPTEGDFLDDFDHAYHDLNLRGLKLAPMYAGFDPNDRRLDALYARCQKLGVPILYHMGTTFVRMAPLKYSRPFLIDEVARRFPELRIVIAHLGHPWEGETLVVIRKHPHVWADIAAIYYRPWQFYNSMILAQEYGVTGKILFGSDYPFSTPAESAQGIRAINRMVEGTNLPRIREESIEAIIERDGLKSLGLR